jgi:glycine/D-amino acid oxidase-like deaminating enzyme
MGRCQGRYCAAVIARLCPNDVDEFGLFAPRPPAKPVPIHALSVEQPEWTGHADFAPPDMARPRDTEPLPVETVDTVVIGGGVAGSCVAYWLAHEGIDTLVVERDELNLQASGANAGSLHVQLLAFDFTGSAPAGIHGHPNRAADTLPLGPASIELWREIQRDTGQDLEIRITGGLMLAETERDIEILKGKIALERSRGVAAELVGANELRRLEPAIGDVAIAAEWCPGEGKINPLKGTFAVVGKAREMGARFRRGSNVQAIERDGTGYRVKTSRGEILCRRIVNAAGPWAAETAKLAGIEIPVRAAPLQMIVTEPAAPTLERLVAYTGRHLTLKQAGSGAFMIGGGWTAGLDEKQKLSRALRPSVEGNLWIAQRAVPALAHLHAIRIWAGMNINIDRAPILGEVPGLPGFYNCVSSNGYTLAPVLSRLTVEMMTGRETSLPVAPYLLSRFG